MLWGYALNCSQYKCVNKGGQNIIYNNMSNAQCSHIYEDYRCTKCGCFYDNKTQTYGVKSAKYIGESLCNNYNFPAQTRRHSRNFVQTAPSSLNPVVNQILQQQVEKFGLSLTTYAKGIYMFHQLLKGKPHVQYQQLRYGAVCLFLATKMTEGSSDVPSLSKFISSACKAFQKTEYVAIEQEVFEAMYQRIFDVHYFTEYLDYYLMKGVVFSTEAHDNVGEIQQKITSIAHKFIKTAQFLNYNQQQLAVYILHTVRQQLKVSEVWNQLVENYTKVGTYEVFNIVKAMKKGLNGEGIISKKIIIKHSMSNVSKVTVAPLLDRTNSNTVKISTEPQPE